MTQEAGVLVGIVIGIAISFMGWMIFSFIISERERNRLNLISEIRSEILNECRETFERKKVI